jgi:polyhydroxyalkanoate synthase subunit PhaC
VPSHPLRLTPAQLSRDLSAIEDRLAVLHGLLEQSPSPENNVSPREHLHSIKNATLYHYKNQFKTRAKKNQPPILIVFALLNHMSILDLSPQKSLIADLVQRGHSVYALDWGSPIPGQNLSDYLCNILPQAVAFTLQHSQHSQLHLLGVCQGGVFSLIHAARHPEHIARLITVVAPFDFHTRDDNIAPWLKQLDLAQLRQMAPLIPSTAVNQWMRQLKPVTLTHTKYWSLLKQANADQLDTFLRLERWLNDSPPLSCEAFCEFIEMFYRCNALVEKTLTLGHEAIALDTLDLPVLNIYAQHDHIVPNAASQALQTMLPNSRYLACGIKAGHIGLFVNDQARSTLVNTLDQWLTADTQKPTTPKPRAHKPRLRAAPKNR